MDELLVKIYHIKQKGERNQILFVIGPYETVRNANPFLLYCFILNSSLGVEARMKD